MAIDVQYRVVDFRMLAQPLSIERINELRIELARVNPEAVLKVYDYALIVEVPEYN